MFTSILDQIKTRLTVRAGRTTWPPPGKTKKRPFSLQSEAADVNFLRYTRFKFVFKILNRNIHLYLRTRSNNIPLYLIYLP